MLRPVLPLFWAKKMWFKVYNQKAVGAGKSLPGRTRSPGGGGSGPNPAAPGEPRPGRGDLRCRQCVSVL